MGGRGGRERKSALAFSYPRRYERWKLLTERNSIQRWMRGLVSPILRICWKGAQGRVCSRRREQSGHGVRGRRSCLTGSLDGRDGMAEHATRGSQGGERRKIARGAHGVGGKWRLFSHEHLSHARCGCSHTIFVQFPLNRGSPLRGESEV